MLITKTRGRKPILDTRDGPPSTACTVSSRYTLEDNRKPRTLAISGASDGGATWITVSLSESEAEQILTHLRHWPQFADRFRPRD